VKCIDVLTGFKYIGEKIKELHAEKVAVFLFGYEESNGFLLGDFVRDKDAVQAALLIAEMSAYYKTLGVSLYERLQEPTLHSIVSACAGIPNIDKKKHGPHALRHSLAGFLLEKKTPLPVISEVLGHTNTESMKTYIRIDLNSLRQCALEVPTLNTLFYEGEVH